MTSDPVADAAGVRRQILDALRRSATLVRLVVAGFVVTVMLLVAILAGVVTITLDTNQAVDRQVEPLQARNAELETQVAQQETVLTQAVDAIVLLQRMLRDAGIEPPEIVLRPPEEP